MQYNMDKASVAAVTADVDSSLIIHRSGSLKWQITLSLTLLPITYVVAVIFFRQGQFFNQAIN